jgi:hypothetical protein
MGLRLVGSCRQTTRDDKDELWGCLTDTYAVRKRQPEGEASPRKRISVKGSEMLGGSARCGV